MEKNWQMAPTIDQEELEKYPEYHPVILRILLNRGLRTASALENFLHASYDQATFDPFLLENMEAVVDLIIIHIKNKDKIVVYGDYDADGVTSAALLSEVLKTVKAEVEVYIPDRISEGYGLNRKAVEEIVEAGAKLIITVDGGIRNAEEVEYAKERGVNVIITDHHIPSPEKEKLPVCLIVNPHLPNDKYPFKYLAGVGVAFKVAAALISKSKLDEATKSKLELSCLDLVAVGTIADCVPLVEENRSLVKAGLKTLTATTRLGLVELKKAAGGFNDKEISAWQVGFQIGPRLNAAGRMEHANTSYELLVTKDATEAVSLADRLNKNNIQRQKDTEEILAAVEEQILGKDKGEIIIGIFQIDETKEQRAWNEGVVGLVAGKIADRYYKPALVITKTKDGYKGSGRSVGDFNLVSAIEKCREFLDKFGGHKMAVGFSLYEDKIEGFTAAIKKIAAEELGGLNLKPRVNIEAELELSEIKEDLLDGLLSMEPFGQDNDRPKFASFGLQVVDLMNMGADGRHLKLRLKGDALKIFSAVGFSQAEKWREVKIGDTIDIVYYLEVNEFNGRREIQMKIIDIKKHSS